MAKCSTLINALLFCVVTFNCAVSAQTQTIEKEEFIIGKWGEGTPLL